VAESFESKEEVLYLRSELPLKIWAICQSSWNAIKEGEVGLTSECRTLKMTELRDAVQLIYSFIKQLSCIKAKLFMENMLLSNE
jgi:hypothetical protein